MDTVYGRFRNFLNFCVDEGRLVTSPAKGVNLPSGNKPEHSHRTIPEVEQLASAVTPPLQDLVW